MDRAANVADNRYQMPTFEDGSEYTNPTVGILVSRRFTPDEWNALTDDRKWQVIDLIDSGDPRPPGYGSLTSYGKPANLRQGNIPRTVTVGRPSLVLAKIDAAVRKAQRKRETGGLTPKGLFGSQSLADKLDLPFHPPEKSRRGR